MFVCLFVTKYSKIVRQNFKFGNVLSDSQIGNLVFVSVCGLFKFTSISGYFDAVNAHLTPTLSRVLCFFARIIASFVAQWLWSSIQYGRPNLANVSRFQVDNSTKTFNLKIFNVTTCSHYVKIIIVVVSVWMIILSLIIIIISFILAVDVAVGACFLLVGLRLNDSRAEGKAKQYRAAILNSKFWPHNIKLQILM